MDNSTQSVADFIWAAKEGEVPVEIIEKKLRLARHEIVSILQELAKEGHGTFVPGRRSRPSRIVKAADRPTTPPMPGVVSQPQLATESAKPTPEIDSSDTSVQIFILKREKPFRFVVPADLTQLEADKIAKWLELVAEG